jgi:hypothetical protein
VVGLQEDVAAPSSQEPVMSAESPGGYLNEHIKHLDEHNKPVYDFIEI